MTIQEYLDQSESPLQSLDKWPDLPDNLFPVSCAKVNGGWEIWGEVSKDFWEVMGGGDTPDIAWENALPEIGRWTKHHQKYNSEQLDQAIKLVRNLSVRWEAQDIQAVALRHLEEIKEWQSLSDDETKCPECYETVPKKIYNCPHCNADYTR